MLTRNGIRKDRAPALLECESEHSCGLWVPHTFARLEPVADSGATAELYRCEGCGHERRWGLIIGGGAPRGD